MKRVNLFVGPNASGKSSVLRAIKRFHSAAAGERDAVSGVYYHEEYDEKGDSTSVWSHNNAVVEMSTSHDWPRDESGSGSPVWGEVPFLYIPATRVHLPSQDVFDKRISAPKIDSYRGITDLLGKLFDTESGIFNGGYVEFAMSAIRQLVTPSYSHDYSLPKPTPYQIKRVEEIGYSCARSICREVIYDETVHPYMELREQRHSSPSMLVHHSMGIGTSDNILGEPLYAGALSSGTQGTLLWIWALAIKMAHHYRWADGWEKQPAILLIDEIENHLHPTWQRRVIPALLEHFPALQIFATTHSPFVVAGLKAGQVHLLKRDENGVVTASTNTEDIVGWTADEILRNLMGVDDPTDDETAKAAREFRQLRSEGPRSDPEEEAARQSRMEELRRFLSRELLAGGTEAAQRELFERQFAEALEKYRQSQEINQENG